jgi:hypothetical protein
LPRINSRSPRRSGRDLRVNLKEVEPHSEDHMLNRKGSKMISEEITLMQTLFLIPEVEEEAEEESSHATHVGRMGIKKLTVQTGRKMEEKLTSPRCRGELLKQKT